MGKQPLFIAAVDLLKKALVFCISIQQTALLITVKQGQMSVLAVNFNQFFTQFLQKLQGNGAVVNVGF